MAISAAFGQLLALETDNVKHLQEAMTKVLQEMPMSERKGLVHCLVHQKDNLATCLAFPNLGNNFIPYSFSISNYRSLCAHVFKNFTELY